MAFGKFFKFFNGGEEANDNTEIVKRALNVHGLDEYRETAVEVKRLKKAIKKSNSKLQKREHKDLLERYECRQRALRGAAVVLAAQLGEEESKEAYQEFSISDKDRSKVTSGITDPRQCPAHELARFFLEESQNDFVMATN